MIDMRIKTLTPHHWSNELRMSHVTYVACHTCHTHVTHMSHMSHMSHTCHTCHTCHTHAPHKQYCASQTTLCHTTSHKQCCATPTTQCHTTTNTQHKQTTPRHTNNTVSYNKQQTTHAQHAYSATQHTLSLHTSWQSKFRSVAMQCNKQFNVSCCNAMQQTTEYPMQCNAIQFDNRPSGTISTHTVLQCSPISAPREL